LISPASIRFPISLATSVDMASTAFMLKFILEPLYDVCFVLT
jgi:hypothetical protein